MTGTTTDGALTVYDVMKNSNDAFLTIFFHLHLADAGVRRTGLMSTAWARHGLCPDSTTGFGNVKVKLDKVSTICKDDCKLYPGPMVERSISSNLDLHTALGQSVVIDHYTRFPSS